MTASTADLALVEAFERGQLDPAGFTHADHVRVAWTLLGPMGRSFYEAYGVVRTGLRALVEKAGRPERYSETITLAFLALVHEEIGRSPSAASFEAFYAGSQGRLDRSALAALYPDGALSTDAARAGLILPTVGRKAQAAGLVATIM